MSLLRHLQPVFATLADTNFAVIAAVPVVE
jgi:hypothetical protein